MGSQARQDQVRAEYFRYVMNDIPLRMIHIGTMKLVDRQFVASYFRQTVENLSSQELINIRVLEAVSSKSYGHRLFVREKVKYAVLSHRWRDKETSYEEMQANGIRDDDKLSQLCRIAKLHGIEFVWADTCCIDKSSSAELDESIRSMFRWYRNSEICVVYLAQSGSAKELVADEWWMRGWTLQEFLAPGKMKFYDKGWKPLTEVPNDKEKNAPLWKSIEEASGIAYEQVRTFQPDPTNVGVRMSWAAKRKTTRDEDVAYSLMGIFNVSLQIAYGEGKERAFIRLIEAIMQSGDPSVLHWAGLTAAHHSSQAIPSGPNCYVGHSQDNLGSSTVLMQQLDIAITSQGLRVPMVVLPLVKAHPDSQKSLRFTCPLIPGATVNAAITGWSGGNHESSTSEYALGIFTYTRLVRTINPGLFGTSLTYLLMREKSKGRAQAPETFEEFKPTNLGLSSAEESNMFYQREWRRIMEDQFITLDIPNAQRFGAVAGQLFFVERKYLEIVYL
ncbi:heterokaryon incompatibility protein-domain-containing protein [Hygrophoropsis aurantiaca]|uniref:Heterokaryon incompatibility protein-domain-containing protein n=1 Tax=Hygrophoropsis aurantiaca TaxID=72124 RepID=A0ACB8APL4_9AGAM|nr:heterokaryon incompatibility protein-domain-containing protein [Hygrophoropsis aurantiaca]